MKTVAGAHPVYTSAEAPGLIYDTLYVHSTSVAANKDAYVKLAKVWDKVVAFIKDPATQDEALTIMSKRVGLTPAEYKPLLGGTRLLSLAEGKKIFVKADGLGSIYGSTAIVDAFNVKNDVYKEPQVIDGYLDPSITNAASP
jgi:NitT/TauT family transport system substrate-binding protein